MNSKDGIFDEMFEETYQIAYESYPLNAAKAILKTRYPEDRYGDIAETIFNEISEDDSRFRPEILKKEVRSMPALQRLIFYRFFVDLYTMEEIAESLSIEVREVDMEIMYILIHLAGSESIILTPENMEMITSAKSKNDARKKADMDYFESQMNELLADALAEYEDDEEADEDKLAERSLEDAFDDLMGQD